MIFVELSNEHLPVYTFSFLDIRTLLSVRFDNIKQVINLFCFKPLCLLMNDSSHF